MVDIDSSDYHDFVIKNMRLVGEFEQMYRKSKDIPWHQDKDENRPDVRLTIEFLREHSPFDYICDFGCGLGYFLDILRRSIGASGCRLVGYDISPTALKKGREVIPDAEFRQLDLMKENESTDKDERRGEKRLFAIRGVLWYVFPGMTNVVKNIGERTKEGDLLLVSQNFPPLETDFVGKDVIQDPDAIIKWFGEYFSPLKTMQLDDKVSEGNDNWFVGTFLRRG